MKMRFTATAILALLVFFSIAPMAVAVVKNEGSSNPPAVKSQGTTNPTAGITLINPLGTGTDLNSLLNSILQFVVRIGAIVVVLMLVYVGFKFVVARGNPQAITEARQMLMWTLIGAMVLLGAQVIAMGIQATVQSLSTGSSSPSSSLYSNQSGLNGTNMYAAQSAAQTQLTSAQAQPTQAAQAYATCLTQNGASNCLSQLSAKNNAESIFNSAKGSLNKLLADCDASAGQIPDPDNLGYCKCTGGYTDSSAGSSDNLVCVKDGTAGSVGSKCNGAEDCGGDFVCPNGTCVAPAGDGESCRDGTTGEDSCGVGSTCNESGVCVSNGEGDVPLCTCGNYADINCDETNFSYENDCTL